MYSCQAVTGREGRARNIRIYELRETLRCFLSSLLSLPPHAGVPFWLEKEIPVEQGAAAPPGPGKPSPAPGSGVGCRVSVGRGVVPHVCCDQGGLVGQSPVCFCVWHLGNGHPGGFLVFSFLRIQAGSSQAVPTQSLSCTFPQMLPSSLSLSYLVSCQAFLPSPASAPEQ